MTTLRAHGLDLRIDRGWEARIWMPDEQAPAENHPVVRIANFALTTSHDTYTTEAVEDLRPGQVVASLVEFSPRLAGNGLYAPAGVPRLRVADLDPNALQGARPGRFGLQRFFSQNGRAFSLYVMAREGSGLAGALHQLETQLRGIGMDAR